MQNMQKRFLPFLLIFSLISTCIEVDISVPGFPEIARFFNVSDGIIQLTIAYNFFGFCLGAMIYGPLSESFGRRKVMIAGNAIMLLGALGCVYSPSIDFLLISRFIQGLGASTSVVLVFAIIADIYEMNRAIKLIGLVNACISISMAVAPLIGGVVNQTVGWRGNYGLVAALTFLSWMLIVTQLPESKQQLDKLQIAKVISDYKKLVFSPKFMSVCLIPSLLFSAYMSYIAASSFLYIGTYELSTIAFVLHQAIIISSFGITSMFSGRIMKYIGPEKMVKAGIGLSLASVFALTFATYYLPREPWVMTFFMSLFCIAFAICYPVIFSASLSVFPELRGTASSVIMGIRALLVSAFTGATSYLYNAEPITVAFIILLGVFAGFMLAINLITSGRFKQEAYAS